MNMKSLRLDGAPYLIARSVLISEPFVAFSVQAQIHLLQQDEYEGWFIGIRMPPAGLPQEDM